MARYQDSFRLNLSDIDIIEQALRAEIARFSRGDGIGSTSWEQSTKITELNCLLGKIHNQKVFYSQVNANNVPAG